MLGDEPLCGARLGLGGFGFAILWGAPVSSERRRRLAESAISLAVLNAASFAFEGLLNPLILRTNCSEAARTSSSVTGGSKLKSTRMFLHMRNPENGW